MTTLALEPKDLKQPSTQDGSGGGRYQLDGYRAIAACAVAVFHAYQTNRKPGGEWPLEGTFWHEAMLATDLFVSLFFVLSGFLLGLPFARSALSQAKARSARMFLLKRFVRIVPLYYIVVLLVWSLTNPELPGDWRDLVLHLTFTHVYSEDKIFYTDGPAWSLAVEVHFYVLLAILGPLAYRACLRLSRRASRLAVLLGGIGVLIGLSLAYKFWAVYVLRAPSTQWPVWFGPPAKLDLFAVGLLLAVLAAAGVRWPARAIRVLVVLAGAGVIALGMAIRPPHDEPDPFVHPVIAAGCALVISATALSTAPGPRWLSWRPLLLVGLCSYSLYLWHEPVLRVLVDAGVLPGVHSPWAFPVTAVLLLVIAIPVAYLSYHVIERTGLKILAAFDAHGRSRDYYAPS